MRLDAKGRLRVKLSDTNHHRYHTVSVVISSFTITNIVLMLGWCYKVVLTASTHFSVLCDRAFTAAMVASFNLLPVLIGSATLPVIFADVFLG